MSVSDEKASDWDESWVDDVLNIDVDRLVRPIMAGEENRVLFASDVRMLVSQATDTYRDLEEARTELREAKTEIERLERVAENAHEECYSQERLDEAVADAESEMQSKMRDEVENQKSYADDLRSSLFDLGDLISEVEQVLTLRFPIADRPRDIARLLEQLDGIAQEWGSKPGDA